MPNRHVRFGGHAVRREFRKGLSFRGAMPPPDAKPHERVRRTSDGYAWPHTGGNTSPYRRYRAQYTLIYRTVDGSYQGARFSRIDYNDWDTARFMPKHKRLQDDKERINRAYRRGFKQQLHKGLEAASEFEIPSTVHHLNCTW